MMERSNGGRRPRGDEVRQTCGRQMDRAPQRKQLSHLAVAVRLRERDRTSVDPYQERAANKLRMLSQPEEQNVERNSRTVRFANLPRLDRHEVEMPRKRCSQQKILCRQRHHSLPRLGAQLSGILREHGGMSARPLPRKDQERDRLSTGQLPMGNPSRSNSQYVQNDQGHHRGHRDVLEGCVLRRGPELSAGEVPDSQRDTSATGASLSNSIDSQVVD